jgi:hypothetical protein
MKPLDALHIIQKLSSFQWGLFTAAQAVERGISRMNLTRLEQRGHIERIQNGIYRSAAAPATRLDHIYAAWLSLSPRLLSYERTKEPVDDVIVSGPTASYILEIGELIPEPLTFSSRIRRQPRSDALRVITRTIPSDDAQISHGLPVTTPERTIADLVILGTDLSLVQNACKDARAKFPELNRTRLIELLGPHAKTHGFRTDDGEAFVSYLLGEREKTHV